MDELAAFNLSIQPMLHVARMGESIAFFEAFGGRLVFGSRDGDWALLRFGGTHLSLLAHPPSPDNPEPVELQFTSATPLERIEEHLQETAPHMIARGTADEAFGRMLQLRTPDGLIVKLLELERDLIE
jgi:hypothetical protein